MCFRSNDRESQGSGFLPIGSSVGPSGVRIDDTSEEEHGVSGSVANQKAEWPINGHLEWMECCR
ncbi:hypothetical protein GCM10025751_51940 [Haladaptatus pallidirubidus]|uniref:Uncharacterized protein n=1 Tax=Haladaptatus pallidirubidus TaxID=1008152 RepID=A0AAV3UR78_9EURY